MACDIVHGRTKNNLERLDVLPDGAVDNSIQDGVSEEVDEETTFQEEFGVKATNNIYSSTMLLILFRMMTLKGIFVRVFLKRGISSQAIKKN
jgi:hypothetical protein